jgi:DNA primase
MGTALTTEHIKEIKDMTNNITFIPDFDTAGNKALEKACEQFINTQIFCNIILLKEKGVFMQIQNTFIKIDLIRVS